MLCLRHVPCGLPLLGLYAAGIVTLMVRACLLLSLMLPAATQSFAHSSKQPQRRSSLLRDGGSLPDLAQCRARTASGGLEWNLQTAERTGPTVETEQKQSHTFEEPSNPHRSVLNPKP